MRDWGLGFGVWGLGFGVRGLGFGVSFYHPRRFPPDGGVRPFHQKSTWLKQLTLGHYLLKIWSRYVRNVEPTKSSNSTVWIMPLSRVEVQGLGVGFQSFISRVSGSGFGGRVLGFKCRVRGLMVQALG